ncbi:Glycerophosphoryl diester phosphodiesterase [Enhygromyxa salina]|uniref:Glycerophosphoryl diester phosphodiesterase n=1 Tax=Enhygromyxa salina TaxID=215803 RepID=A0A2S9XIU9_9BACT|nr:glycerophosphodiester phosphodiesterase [Enhygromyxa salina]PRP92806.1 Glycerophosphoryl diester phosphodiesterase [Enhygromyxa salina]
MQLRALGLSLCLGSCLGLLACGGGDEASAADGDTGTDASTDERGTTGESTETETGAETETETGETETGETGEPPGNLFLSDELLNIAHRGGASLRPEATLIAFENALAVGADVLEFDLHASSDGVIVVMHDDTVDRTTDGSGAIKDMSFDELRMLDAGYTFTTDGGETYPYRGMGLQIPTLEEVFEAFPDAYYMIEIKQAEPSIVADLLPIIADHGVGERLVLASFEQITLDEIRAQDPAQVTTMSAPEMVDLFSMGAEPGYEPPALFIQAPWEVVDQELVDVAHGHGIKVHPWTVNTEPLMEELIGYGVDGLITDDPALLDSLLGG